MVLSIVVAMVKKHKTLPLELAKKFTLAFKTLNENLATRQDASFKSRE
jgi:hypothetical protein